MGDFESWGINHLVIIEEDVNIDFAGGKSLTRLGFNSKIVVTGDITQIDLPDGKKSGLVEAMKILKGIDDIAINVFTEKDVVRHRLVQDIIKAYEKQEMRKNK